MNYQKSDLVRDAADALYAACENANISVLFDDRGERPGIKFADADLLGIPLRVTIGERTLAENQLEYETRAKKDKQLVAVDAMLDILKQACSIPTS